MTPEGTRDQVIEMLKVLVGVVHCVQVIGRATEAPPRQVVGGGSFKKKNR